MYSMTSMECSNLKSTAKSQNKSLYSLTVSDDMEGKDINCLHVKLVKHQRSLYIWLSRDERHYHVLLTVVYLCFLFLF